MRKIILLVTLALISGTILAQKDFRKKSEKFFAVAPAFGVYNPGGDYSEYFGVHFNLGGRVLYKSENNFVFSAASSFIFGNQVESSTMLKHVRTENNEILDEQGQIAVILFFQRGFNMSLSVGKIFNQFLSRNPNSGPTLSAGIGFLQHKVLVENQNNRIPNLDGEYEKYYDRLTNGLMLTQSIGYTNFSNSRLANFYIGIEIMEGFTSNKRDYNFDLDGPDKSPRLDLSFGFKVNWIIPMYTRMSSEYYID